MFHNIIEFLFKLYYITPNNRGVKAYVQENIKMANINNRYLNLTGAPWAPNRSDNKTTLANYFGIVASGASIFLAAQINPLIEKNQLVHLLESLAGAGIAIALTRHSRYKEARSFSSRQQSLVIDTAPDKSTPPTSPDILGRVTNKTLEYKAGGFLAGRSLSWGTAGMLLGSSDFFRIAIYDPSLHVGLIGPHGLSIFGGFFLTESIDIISRYRQLRNISELKWVISDQGDAIKEFQKEDQLNPRKAMAFSSARIDL